MAARKKTPDILSDILGETPAKKGGKVKQSTSSIIAKGDVAVKPQNVISQKTLKKPSRKVATQEMSPQPMQKSHKSQSRPQFALFEPWAHPDQ